MVNMLLILLLSSMAYLGLVVVQMAKNKTQAYFQYRNSSRYPLPNRRKLKDRRIKKGLMTDSKDFCLADGIKLTD